MTLGSLAYACRLYDAMTDFGRSFGQFQRQVDGKPKLERQDHRQALLEWLNAWGCRHLAVACHKQVSREIEAWYDSALDLLPTTEDRLLTIDDDRLVEYGRLFDQLSSLPARQVFRQGQVFPVSFGPTAASKTLFALRPHVFVAWDDAMRHGFKADGTGTSYVCFVRRVRDDLQRIEQQSLLMRIELEGLPERLGRSGSTLAQLVGEYYWMTVTRKVVPPDTATLHDWLVWSDVAREESWTDDGRPLAS